MPYLFKLYLFSFSETSLNLKQRNEVVIWLHTPQSTTSTHTAYLWCYGKDLPPHLLKFNINTTWCWEAVLLWSLTLATKPTLACISVCFASDYQKTLLLPCYNHLQFHAQNKHIKQWPGTVDILVFPRIRLNTVSQRRKGYNLPGNPSMWYVRAKNMTVYSPKQKTQGNRWNKATAKGTKTNSDKQKKQSRETSLFIGLCRTLPLLKVDSVPKSSKYQGTRKGQPIYYSCLQDTASKTRKQQSNF